MLAYETVRSWLDTTDAARLHAFDMLKTIGQMATDKGMAGLARELVIRSLERGVAFDECRPLHEALIRQVTGSVKWNQSTQWLVAHGVQTFVEVGPGKVLCGLMRQIDRSKKCLNVEDEASLIKTLEFLNAGIAHV